jgi:thioredoxin reductase
MPAGMVLRSAGDWHLDPSGVYTIERFLETRGLKRADVEPLSVEFYLGYADWFADQACLDAVPGQVRELNQVGDRSTRFRADLENGDSITADAVVVAVGFRYFAHIPADLARCLPDGRFAHTCDLVDFRGLKDHRCLIIGGRQSAFEWAALLHEAGADAVHISHRHDSPSFSESDWSWVDPLVARFDQDPGWYRRLSPDEQEAVNHRLWAEGRLKVEPWLEARCRTNGITVWPRTQVVSAVESHRGDIDVTLDNGAVISVDQIIFATGYRPDIARVPFLSRGNLLPRMAIRNGCPVLDDTLQTTIPGLYMTSFLAKQDFGPFFAFTVAARVSARLVARGLLPQDGSSSLATSPLTG